MRLSLYSLVTLLIVLISASTAISDEIYSPKRLIYLTEQYPPHNYQDKGQIKGVSVEILQAIWDGLSVDLSSKDIKIVPWARGMKSIRVKDNVVLFGMGYSKERAKEVHWIGPYYANKLVLIAKKSRQIKIGSLDEAKEYLTGVIRDDVGDQHLREKGFNKSQIAQANNMKSLLRMLRLDRIPLVSFMNNVFLDNAKSMGMNPDDYEVVYVLRETRSGYGFSKAVPIKLVNKFQAELDKLIANGSVERIVDKYMRDNEK